MVRILAIEPDVRQAAILKRVIKDLVRADLAVVNSKDAAVAAIETKVPDLLLVSTLLSPREEEELVAHLRTLDRAEHLQTLTIPLLASSPSDEDHGRRLLGMLRRRRPAARLDGCDPQRFAQEILGYLQRAEEAKAEWAAREQADAWAATRAAELVSTQGTEGPAGALRPGSSGGDDDSVWQWRSKEAPPVELQQAGESSADTAPAGDVIDGTSVNAAASETTTAVSDASAAEPSGPTEPARPTAPAATAEKAPPDNLKLRRAPHLSAASLGELLIEEMAEIDSSPADQSLSPADSDEPAAAALGSEVLAPGRLFERGGDRRLTPLAMLARVERARPSGTEKPETTADLLEALLQGLHLPLSVANVTYAQGCRLRRVRIADTTPPKRSAKGPADALVEQPREVSRQAHHDPSRG